VEKHTHQLGLLRCANSQRVSLLESAKYHALQKASRCRHLANYYDTWKHSSRDSSWHSRNTNYSKSKKFKKVIKYFQFSAHVFNFHAGTIRLLGSAVPWGALKPILLQQAFFFKGANFSIATAWWRRKRNFCICSARALADLTHFLRSDKDNCSKRGRIC